MIRTLFYKITVFIKKPYLVYFLGWFFVYLLIVVAAAAYNGAGTEKHLLRQIDEQLLIAAKSLRYMLVADFHDRAVDKNSISYEEELRNRKAFSQFAFETNLKGVYTLVPKDGKFYFSAPTISEKEAKEQKTWYFYPYDDAPLSFWRALKEKKAAFVSYRDQWGSFRSVVLPQQSSSGKPYLACADYEISYIKEIIKAEQYGVLLVGVILFLASIPFLLFYRLTYKAHSKQLERKNTELKEYQAHLQELVKERTKELLLAKEEAEEAARMKSKLLSSVSHEIRTPLHAIIAFSELIAHSHSVDEVHFQIRSVLGESKALLRLIDDLLDQARLEAGKVDFKAEEFYLPLLLEEVKNFMNPVAVKKGLILSLHIDERLKICVVSDDYRLRQILVNLVGNAVKFTDTGSVTVEAVLSAEDSETIEVLFKVVDTGIGIPPDKLKYIFEAFFMVEDGFARKQKGTGLGTAIVKSLVERMGGRVDCYSQLGKGSIFWFKLPLKKSGMKQKSFKKEGAADPGTVSYGFEGFNGEMLVVEDNEVNQVVARLQLNHLGIKNITIAKDGSEAIDKCRSKNFDIILTDLHMPQMDGYEMTRQLRVLNDFYKTVPIIAITADAGGSVFDECKSCGISAIVTKPLMLDGLAVVLRKWLKR